jgi:hypothetical protein
MSKEKAVKNKSEVVESGPSPEVQAALSAVPPPPPAQERLSEVDRMALELAKSQRQTALAEAKTALANNEKSELAYKYVVLQLYMKYGLTDRDAISEAGEIIRDGAIQPPPQGR